jgi:hypothetical protein
MLIMCPEDNPDLFPISAQRRPQRGVISQARGVTGFGRALALVSRLLRKPLRVCFSSLDPVSPFPFCLVLT